MAWALAIGPTLGGALIEGFGWRSIFMIVIPLKRRRFCAGAGGCPRIRRSTTARFRLDGAGQWSAGAGRLCSGGDRIPSQRRRRCCRLHSRSTCSDGLHQNRGWTRHGRFGSAADVRHPRIPRRGDGDGGYDFRHVRHAVSAAARLAERRDAKPDRRRSRLDALGHRLRPHLPVLWPAGGASRLAAHDERRCRDHRVRIADDRRDGVHDRPSRRRNRAGADRPRDGFRNRPADGSGDRRCSRRQIGDLGGADQRRPPGRRDDRRRGSRRRLCAGGRRTPRVDRGDAVGRRDSDRGPRPRPGWRRQQKQTGRLGTLAHVEPNRRFITGVEVLLYAP